MTSRKRSDTAARRAAIGFFAVAGVISVFPTAAGALSAASTVFKVTGAGSGTLTAGQYSGCLDTNVPANGLTAVNGLVGHISNYANDVASWSLDVTERKTGTFKFNGTYTAQPTAELFAAAKGINYSKVTKDQFFARSGTITVGTGKGSLNASFMNTVGKSIKVVGTWSCQS